MIRPPAELLDPKLHRRKSSLARIVVAAALLLFTGWQLLGLPGQVLQQLRLPEDVPTFGVGLRGVYVGRDGTWVVRRSYYADRMGRYEIDPRGKLTAFAGALHDTGNPELLAATGEDTKHIFMHNGHSIAVKASRDYYAERKRIRDKFATDPAAKTLREDENEKAVNEAVLRNWKEPYVRIYTYRENARVFPVLQGHEYYKVLDSDHFTNPDLWLTTDKVQWLHRVRCTDDTPDGRVEIKPLVSVKLNLGVKVDYDTELVLDYTAGPKDSHGKPMGELALLLPTGDRFWFDRNTLVQLGRDKLPGVWEREYGQLGLEVNRAREFPQYSQTPGGIPLTEAQFKAIRGGIAVIFILSLLTLAWELFAAWRSTSARTTAATS